MSRPASCIALVAVVVAACSVVAVRAQTIGDYSRAQRAWLESSMSQSAARSAAAPSSAPAAVASAPASGPVATLASAHVMLPATGPSLQVSGVFESGTLAMAEIVVNATAYLLEVGQPVPGTPWHVDAIATDRVVMSRHGGPAWSDGDGARKVFSLPAMR